MSVFGMAARAPIPLRARAPEGEALERLVAVGLELAAGAALAGGAPLAPIGLAHAPSPAAGPTAPAGRHRWGPLSAREREVAALIAEG